MIMLSELKVSFWWLNVLCLAYYNICVKYVLFCKAEAWLAFSQLQAGTGLIYGASERNLKLERNIVNGGWQYLIFDTLLLQLQIQDLQACRFVCGVYL